MGRKVRVGAALLLTGLLSAAAVGVTTAQAGAATVRGFNGKTITVGAVWYAADFPNAQVGAQAFFSQLNKTNYLKGIKIKFDTYLNDDADPATALSAARQLVTQDQVFAIVPDLSDVNPASYLKSQQVPYVGGGFDYTYCSTNVSTSVWGFSTGGCLVPQSPKFMSNTYRQFETYVAAKTDSAHPTIALFSNSGSSGSNSVRLATVSAKGAGFDVVYVKAPIPTVASDYTPYVEQIMTANHGKPPQAVGCQLTEQCIPMWAALKNAGFKGSYWSPLGVIAALDSAMAGTVTTSTFNNEPNPGLTTMQNAMDAVAPGTQLQGYANVPAYFAASLFATAVHLVQTKHEAITPQNVQKALSTITWSIPGLAGPIKYPASTVAGTPYCTEFLAYSGGTTKMIYPYSCTSKVFKVTPQAEKVS